MKLKDPYSVYCHSERGAVEIVTAFVNMARDLTNEQFNENLYKLIISGDDQVQYLGFLSSFRSLFEAGNEPE